MKKILILTSVLILMFLIAINLLPSESYAANDTYSNSESQLIQLKKSQEKTLEEYKKKYNSETYGFTAYVLHLVQIYSIPFCFLGIVISIIYKVVMGTRNIENAEKGLGMIVAIVTVTIICQVLPLVFAVVVKMGKE